MLAPAIVLLALAWLALLLASPFGPVPLAALIYGIGGFICHQIPERSFHLGGLQIPVCARCLGIYAGFAVTAGVYMVSTSFPASSRPRELTPSSARWVFVAGALPTAATLGLEWSGVWSGSNIVRAIAGIALGAAVALVVVSAAATLHYNSCERRRPTGPSQRLPHT